MNQTHFPQTRGSLADRSAQAPVDARERNAARSTLRRPIFWLPLCVAALSLAGCGGGVAAGSQGNNSACANACYVSGTVAGLNANQNVKLENNGGDRLTVAYNANDYFTFPVTQAAGSSYDVTVASHPPAVACSVSNGSGTLVSNVTDIAVACAKGTERILYSFAGGTADGADPNGGLIIDGAGNLYGTTGRGGADGLGTVFEVSATGTERVLHSFVGGPTDGSNPAAGLVVDGAGNLYGTTYGGGASGLGTVFEVSATGAERILHSFAGGAADGANPSARLVIDSAGNLYGTTYGGGASGLGTVFEVSATGAERILHSFAGGLTDGASPDAGLLLDGDILYGTTSSGSFLTAQNGGAACTNNSGCGTVFGLGINGFPQYTVHAFVGGPTDGQDPVGGLLLGSDGNLYGTTYTGGANANGAGTVFQITPAGETVLYSFAGGTTDGAGPAGGLAMDSAGNLYGTTQAGGASGAGTVFEIN
jgi:uncharacterized repeat protein (TIGR03803 family)